MAIATLQYPPSLGNEVKQGQHYVLFESYSSKNALASGTVQDSIALYIPPNALKTSFSQNFEGLSGGETLATAGQLGSLIAAGEFGRAFNQVSTLEGFGNVSGDIASNLFSKNDTVRNILSATQGLAINNHMALLYRGPGQFRTHDFSFSFFPKNRSETETVTKIILAFQDAMTPKKATITGTNTSRVTAPYFRAPNQFAITFFTGGQKNRYLPEIKRSVLESMSINHDPNSVVSLHGDGSPVNSSMTLSFKEIEYVTSKEVVSVEVPQFTVQDQYRGAEFDRFNGLQ